MMKDGKMTKEKLIEFLENWHKYSGIDDSIEPWKAWRIIELWETLAERYDCIEEFMKIGY